MYYMKEEALVRLKGKQARVDKLAHNFFGCLVHLYSFYPGWNDSISSFGKYMNIEAKRKQACNVLAEYFGSFGSDKTSPADCAHKLRDLGLYVHPRVREKWAEQTAWAADYYKTELLVYNPDDMDGHPAWCNVWPLPIAAARWDALIEEMTPKKRNND